LDRSGPCVFDPRAFSLAAADARLGWIRGGGPEPEPDGRGMTITQPTSSAPGPPSTPASWSPLEERLVWQRLEGLLAAPEWREAAELARSIFEAGLEVCPSAVERAALLAEPRFEQLRFDYLACDLVFDRKQRPPVLELLAASSGAGLTPGAAEFLAALFRSCLGLYRIEAVRADGTLRLWDVAGERRFEASPPQPDFDAESGRLLISRVLPGRDGLARLRGGLTAPYVVEELGDLLRHLTQDCRAAGGDHQDPFQLLKPSAPYLVAFWFVQTRRDGEGGLRLALGAGEVWEPGVGEYGVPRGGDLAAVAAALDRCPELIAHLTDLWMLPAGGGGGEEAAGWLKLHDQGLYLFAANRGSMKVLRETLKRAGCPGLRHRVTRYDPGLRLPLVPVERS
ncbi:MAG: hypothetical protein ISR76_07610, partial [Planctomycetes bacterium]|nr:hypothetical protein [Planctomycetota bacterium]